MPHSKGKRTDLHEKQSPKLNRRKEATNEQRTCDRSFEPKEQRGQTRFHERSKDAYKLDQKALQKGKKIRNTAFYLAIMDK